MDESGRVRSVVAGQIEIDGGTQARVRIDEATVAEYVEAIEAGAEFPPLEVWFDGTTYWLADGFHRFLAYLRKTIGLIPCIVKRGTKEDAQWAACGANRTHGLKRSNADKRKAVELALDHPKSAGMSDGAIADHVGVSREFVLRMRKEISSGCDPITTCEIRTGRDGKSYPVRARDEKPYTARGLPSPKRQANPSTAPDDDRPEGDATPSPVVGASKIVATGGAVREALASAALDGDTQSVPTTVTQVAVPDRVLRDQEENIGPGDALQMLNQIAAAARKWDDSVVEKAETIRHVESLLRVYRGDEPDLISRDERAKANGQLFDAPVRETPADIDLQADEIYAAYPRKAAPAAAKKAIKRALKQVSFAELRAAVRRYAEAVAGADLSALPHPSTWFNGARWEDGEAEWQAAAGLEQRRHPGISRGYYEIMGAAG